MIMFWRRALEKGNKIMLNQIKGIKFKGAAFGSETILQLFNNNESDRMSLIFGRNGSGKSTLSRAISKASVNETIEDIVSARFVDSSESDVAISDDEKKRVFVFNEDYINSKVRLKEDGLNTIVMFGKIGDIADKIERATEVLRQAEKSQSEQNEKFCPYNDVNNIQSPENQYERVKTKLKGDKSWADRERLIMGFKQNASVTDAVVSEIMKNTPAESQSISLKVYEAEYATLQTAKSAGSKIMASTPKVNDYSTQIQTIVKLLAEKIEEPTLTVREKRLLSLAQTGRQSMLTEIKTEFLTQTYSCPFCLQPVTDEYKSQLIKSIEKVLNKAAEEHSHSLEKGKIQPVSMNFTAFAPVDKTTTDNCQKAVDIVNSQIMECNQAIEQKKNNLYTPIIGFSTELQKSVDKLKDQLSELEKEKKEYNDRIDSIRKTQEGLRALNKDLAYYEIEGVYADFIKQKDEKERVKAKLREFAVAVEKARRELEDLIQQKRNVKIAVDFINRGLQYVFFSVDKLKVGINGDNYTLLSKNKPVKPKNISVGERNILALCYFFTELLNNTDEKDVHKVECFIVLDDPVSSFDLENRVGIISYLKSQISKVLRGNQNSKIVLLSHDLLTIYDIDKAFGEVANQIKLRVGSEEKKITYGLFELDKQAIGVFSRKRRNEYSQLLMTVYEYASNRSNDYELVIGNIMRRVLEAFGTFEYRKGIDEISCDQAILENIAADKRDYFENLMYRLILNGESHFEERTKSQTDNNFFATITPDEKRRTAKDVLCFMYSLNRNHIKAQFHAMKDDIGVDVIENIEKWLSAIAIPQDCEEAV